MRLLAAVILALSVALMSALAAGGGRAAPGASSPAPTLPSGKIRTYYIAADTGGTTRRAGAT
jgi:hypothetical protein